MLAYAIIMFLIAALLAALGIAVYGGRTELVIGTGIGIGRIASVQKKYNGGMF